MKRLLLLLWLGTTPCTHGGFVVLGKYEFEGTSTGDNQLNVVSTPSENATFSTVTRVNVGWNSGANVFNSKNWSESSIDLTGYVEFSIKANPHFTITLDWIDFGASRSSYGPTNAAVYVFNTASPANDATPWATFFYEPPVMSSPSVSSNRFDFANFTTPDEGTATFRFYGFNAGGSGGTMRFDNIQVYGQVTPVPEPIEWALGIFGGIFLTAKGIQFWRKRRQPSPIVTNAG
jgi:hypothetical protein